MAPHCRDLALALARWVPWLLVASLLIACGAATPEEFDAYRAIRYGQGTARISAAESYLRRFPTGHHADEARSIVASDEASFWEANHRTAAGLHEYLTLFPGGAHSIEARARLRIVHAGRFEPDPLTSPELARAEEQARREPGRLFLDWVSSVAAATEWNEPVTGFYAANRGFAREFHSPPEPRCAPGACTRILESTCIVNERGTRTLERAPIVIRLLARGTRVVGVDIAVRTAAISLWHACATDSAWHPDGSEEALERRWLLGQLEGVIRHALADAQPTPATVTGRALDRVAPDAVLPSSPGIVRWSVLSGCGAREPPSGAAECMRIDGFESIDRNEIGVRFWALPPEVIAGFRAEAGLTSSPPERSESPSSGPSHAIDVVPAIPMSATAAGSPEPVERMSAPSTTEESVTTQTSPPQRQNPPRRRASANLVYGGMLLGAAVRVPLTLTSFLGPDLASGVLGQLPLIGPTYFAVRYQNEAGFAVLAYSFLVADVVSVGLMTSGAIMAYVQRSRRHSSGHAWMLFPIRTADSVMLNYGVTF